MTLAARYERPLEATLGVFEEVPREGLMEAVRREAYRRAAA